MQLYEILAGVAKNKVAPPAASLWAWGYRTFVDNSILARSSPAQIGAGTSWKSLFTSVTGGAGIRNDNTLWLWGVNNYGQLGDSSIINRSSPVQVAGGGSWTQVAMNFYGTWALKTDGTMWTWGWNAQNQLGAKVVSAPPSWSMLDTNGNTVIGIQSNTLYMWGVGSSYERPTNDYNASNIIVPFNVFATVGANNVAGINTVSAGYVTAVYKAQMIPGPAVLALARVSPDGVAAGNTYLLGWGYNSSRVLRSVAQNSYQYPKAAIQFDQPITDFWASRGSEGLYYNALDVACYVKLANNQSIWAWGGGNIGLGNTSYAWGSNQGPTSPILVFASNASYNFVDLQVGKGHTLALANTGALWAWGGISQAGQAAYNVSHVQTGTQANLIMTELPTYQYFPPQQEMSYNPSRPQDGLGLVIRGANNPANSATSFLTLLGSGRTTFTLYNANNLYSVLVTTPGQKLAVNTSAMNQYGQYQGFNQANNTSTPRYLRGSFGYDTTQNLGEAFAKHVDKLTSNTNSTTPRQVYFSAFYDDGSTATNYSCMAYAANTALAGQSPWPMNIILYSAIPVGAGSQPSYGAPLRTMTMAFNSNSAGWFLFMADNGDSTATIYFMDSASAQDWYTAFTGSYYSDYNATTISGGFIPSSIYSKQNYSGLYRFNGITSLSYTPGDQTIIVSYTSVTTLSMGYQGGGDDVYIRDGFTAYTAPTSSYQNFLRGRESYDVTVPGLPTNNSTYFDGTGYTTFYGFSTATLTTNTLSYTSNGYILVPPGEAPTWWNFGPSDNQPRLVKYAKWANGTVFNTANGFKSIGASNSVSIMLLTKDSANLVLTMGNNTTGALLRTQNVINSNDAVIPTVVSYVNGSYSNTGANWIWVKASQDTVFMQNGNEYAAGSNTVFPANAIFYGGNNSYYQAGNTTASVASPTMILSAWNANSTFWFRATPNTFSSSNLFSFMALSDGTSWTAANGTTFSNGAIVSSGWNGSGQLGVGTSSAAYSPIVAMGGTEVTYFSSPVQITVPRKFDGTNATNSWTMLNAVADQGSNGPLALHADGTLYQVGYFSTEATFIQAFGTNWYLLHGIANSQSRAVQITTSSFTMVSSAASPTGYRANYVIKTDGTLWGWSAPFGYSQQYLHSITARPSTSTGYVARQVFNHDVTSWKQVSTGTQATFAIAADNTLWGWGLNTNGMLTAARPMGKSLTQNFQNTWSSVSTSIDGSTAAAVGSDGGLYVWGTSLASNGAVIQLFDTTASNTTPPETTTATPRFWAKPLFTGSSWTQVNVSDYHIAAIRTDGTLWTWGSGTYGRLGDGTVNNYAVSPIQLAGSWSVLPTATVSNWWQLAAKTDGTVWAWGQIPPGLISPTPPTQLEWYNFIYRSSPVQVQSSITGTPIVQIETIFNTITWNRNSVAPIVVRKNDNTLWGWGGNAHKTISAEEVALISSPVQVAAGSWSQVCMAPTGEMMIGIKTDGTLWGWGQTVKPYYSDIKVESNNLWPTGHTGTQTRRSWSMIDFNGYAYAGITSIGELYTWGKTGTEDLDGAILGHGQATNLPAPRKLTNDSWTAVSVGAGHMLGIKSNGTLWAWGVNTNGQLGLGDTTNYPKVYTPLQVGTSSWTAVAAGNGHSMAIRSDGTLWVMGYGSTGNNNMLGDNGSVSRSSPVQLMAGNTIIKIATNWPSNARYAITNLGALYTWGGSLWGETGLGFSGITGTTTTPTKLGTSSWSQVSAGPQHAHFIRSDGALFATGYNGVGNLGDSTIISKSSPVQIGTLTGWTNVTNSKRYFWSYGSRTTTLFGWGQAGFGETNITPVNRSSPVQLAMTGNAVAAAMSVSAGLVSLFSNTHANVMFVTANVSHGNQQVLGDQPVTYVTTPVQLIAGSWSMVGFGSNATVHAIRSDGSLWGWGDNWTGEIGNATVTNVGGSSPVQIGLSSWTWVMSKGRAMMRDINGNYFTTGQESLPFLYANTSGYDKIYDVWRSRVTPTAQYASSPVQVGNLVCSVFTEPVLISSDPWYKIAVGDYRHNTINVATSNTGVYINDTVVAGIKKDYTLWIWGTTSSNGSGTGVYNFNSNTTILSSPTQVGSNSDIYIDVSTANGSIITLKA